MESALIRGNYFWMRRLHAPAQLRLAKFAGHLSQDTAVRRHSGFRAGKLDRNPADRGDSITLTRLHDAGRSDCGGNGQAGDLNLCIRWCRLGLAYGCRAH